MLFLNLEVLIYLFFAMSTEEVIEHFVILSVTSTGQHAVVYAWQACKEGMGLNQFSEERIRQLSFYHCFYLSSSFHKVHNWTWKYLNLKTAQY